MIEGLPWYVPLTIVFVNAFFWSYWIRSLSISLRAQQNPHGKLIVAGTGIGLLLWLFLQGTLAYRGFYLQHEMHPFRVVFAIGPPLFLIFLSLVFRPIRNVLEGFPLTHLTYVHTMRFFVELVVWALYLEKYTPRIMTFAGLNPDIVIGLTAPIIAYLCFSRRVLSPRIALIWHMIGLLFLVNVTNWFMLTIPMPQPFIPVEYPNVGFFYFPFIWAPSHGVPTVILAHCIAIRLLWRQRKG